MMILLFKKRKKNYFEIHAGLPNRSPLSLNFNYIHKTLLKKKKKKFKGERERGWVNYQVSSLSVTQQRHTFLVIEKWR
jgi:hypothetical protein